jgi:hypothetical protein
MSNSNQTGGCREAPAEPEPGVDKNKEKQPPDLREIGGPPGPEPTRYGDWEKGGRCIDF